MSFNVTSNQERSKRKANFNVTSKSSRSREGRAQTRVATPCQFECRPHADGRGYSAGRGADRRLFPGRSDKHLGIIRTFALEGDRGSITGAGGRYPARPLEKMRARNWETETGQAQLMASRRGIRGLLPSRNAGGLGRNCQDRRLGTRRAGAFPQRNP